MLHIYAGDRLRDTKRYEEAFIHRKQALEMEPGWLSPAYSTASGYEELGDYANAANVYSQIADNPERRGFEGEAGWPRSMAQKCREK